MAEKLPKLAYFRPGQAVTMPIQALPFQSGLPLSVGSTIREHLEARSLVGNLGNMIHRMAMIQMTVCDRSASAQINLFKIIKKYKSVQKAADQLNKHFDGLVMTMSNILRPDATEPDIADLVERLHIPVYCLGVGLQGPLPHGDKSVLHSDIIDLISVLDRKAALFGVRGEETLAWLQSIGVSNAQAIGCPSMFAYPANILKIQSPKKTEKIISAGHLALTSAQDSRGHKLMRAFGDVRPAYVFQGEIAYFKEIMEREGIYDEATQSLSAGEISSIIEKKCKITPPFAEYYSFGEVASWRQVCTKFDLYIGDRIHGGVAAMQVGKPALVLYADKRVQELAFYHGIPSCSLDEFESGGVQAVTDRHLSDASIAEFHARYRVVLRKFEDALSDSGLKLFNRTL